MPSGIPDQERFEFSFDRRFVPLLAALGVTRRTASVVITPSRLAARFGPWSCSTPLANISEVCVTGPYRWYTAIGPRLSLADRGLTFGTNVHAGVCVLFREPVHGLEPLGVMRHPGLTVTVAEPDRFAAAVRQAATAAGGSAPR